MYIGVDREILHGLEFSQQIQRQGNDQQFFGPYHMVTFSRLSQVPSFACN